MWVYVVGNIVSFVVSWIIGICMIPIPWYGGNTLLNWLSLFPRILVDSSPRTITVHQKKWLDAIIVTQGYVFMILISAIIYGGFGVALWNILIYIIMGLQPAAFGYYLNLDFL